MVKNYATYVTMFWKVFLESEYVSFLFLFSDLFVFPLGFFVCIFVCLFFFLGRDGGQYSHRFINLWNPGGGDITGPVFSPHVSLGSWIPR